MHHLYGIPLTRNQPNQEKQLTQTKADGVIEQQIGLTAIGESGSIEASKMDGILGKNRKTICIDVEDICASDVMPFEKELVRMDETIKGPRLGLASYKIGQCEIYTQTKVTPHKNPPIMTE